MRSRNWRRRVVSGRSTIPRPGSGRSGKTVLSPAVSTDAAGYEHLHLRGQPRPCGPAELVGDPDSAVSLVGYVVEALGFWKLDASERSRLERFFLGMEVLPIPDLVAREAVRLRQQRKMGLGDSIVAGTALVHGRTLVTRNARDFQWIPGLKLLNPFSWRPTSPSRPRHHPPPAARPRTPRRLPGGCGPTRGLRAPAPSAAPAPAPAPCRAPWW